MTTFDTSLRNYCRKNGIREQTVFILAYKDMNRARSRFQYWKKTGDVPPIVCNKLRELGALDDGKPDGFYDDLA